MSATVNTSATGGYVTDQPPSVLSGEHITRLLQKMVMALTGLPGTLVRPRWQPMPPSQPPAETTWASVGVQRVEADEFPYIVHDPSGTFPGALAPGVDRMQRHATLTVLVTFYGPEAEDTGGRLRDALYIPQQMEGMRPLKLLTVRDLARAPEMINQQWIDRVDLEIDLRMQINRVYPIYDLAGADLNIRTDQADSTDTAIAVRPPDVATPHD